MCFQFLTFIKGSGYSIKKEGLYVIFSPLAGECVCALVLIERLFNLVKFNGYEKLILTAAVLMVLNGFLKSILHLLSFPITVLTLGLFSFVINGMIVLIAFRLSGVEVKNFSTAFVVGILLTIINLAIRF